ncbi:hypothetical protein EYF80_033209 [Liparis tanakae]|uniref:MADF domain-containing protein n=1 Tax=Liparis tanakae TaxID=230148 RepID=A0A4Z2GVC6_9TELE|nr:hypothetical protein EYF80_033209 [Liparis tanakae]
MNAIEELLSEEVRRYEHLYNPSMAGYKDAQMASNSWREISSNVVLAVDLCLKIPSGPGRSAGLSAVWHLVVRTAPPTTIRTKEIQPRYSAGPQSLCSSTAPSSGCPVWWHVQAVGTSSRSPDRTKRAPENTLTWPRAGNHTTPVAPIAVAKPPAPMAAMTRARHVRKFPERDMRDWVAVTLSTVPLTVHRARQRVRMAHSHPARATPRAASSSCHFMAPGMP